MQLFKGSAVWQGISDVISLLINEKLRFQVARPMAAIQFEWGQEGHLSLAARWLRAKPVEEPHSLHPITGTWTGAPEQPHISFSLTEDMQICVHGHSHSTQMHSLIFPWDQESQKVVFSDMKRTFVWKRESWSQIIDFPVLQRKV